MVRPSEATTASKAAVNVASRSRIRKRNEVIGWSRVRSGERSRPGGEPAG